MSKKFCVKCGHEFEAVGREVICPACKESAAEEARHAAVLRAKRASWTGESVPVRISGRASTIIRKYGAEKGLPFAAALDALLQASAFFKGMGVTWNEIAPYKSRRMKSSNTVQNTADKPQEAAGKAAEKPVKAAAKTSASKTVKVVKAAGKAGKNA